MTTTPYQSNCHIFETSIHSGAEFLDYNTTGGRNITHYEYYMEEPNTKFEVCTHKPEFNTQYIIVEQCKPLPQANCDISTKCDWVYNTTQEETYDDYDNEDQDEKIDTEKEDPQQVRKMPPSPYRTLGIGVVIVLFCLVGVLYKCYVDQKKKNDEILGEMKQLDAQRNQVANHQDHNTNHFAAVVVEMSSQG